MGLNAKRGKTPSSRLDYLIEVQEVKPWPPSQSLRTLRSVLLQWEHGDRKSGSTNPVVPSLGSGTTGDGKIEFNQSFKLSMAQLRQTSTKVGEKDSSKKNCLEFNLYECRMDKTVKGQSLGAAIVDLADYGVVKEALNLCIPMNSKRSFSNMTQPALSIKIQSIGKGGTDSSPRENLSKESSMERNGGESVSSLTNKEYVEGTESASITDDDDDDVSSHSSLAVSSGFETNVAFSPDGGENVSQTLKDSSAKSCNKHLSTSKQEQSCEISEVPPSYPSSTDSSPETSLISMPEKIATHSGQSSPSSITCEVAEEEVNTKMKIKCSDGKEYEENGQVQMLHEGQDYEEDESWMRFSDVTKNGSVLHSDRLKHVKSVRSPMDSVMSNGSFRSGKLADTQNGAQAFVSSERDDAKVYPVEARSTSNARIKQLEHRIKMLEGELREAAAIEVGLYSVVAEHGSSISKVHAPARRLARLYLHACKESSLSRRASAARSAVSGLVLVAKACGNDVPRLTFWLSNSVVLRAIISQAIAEQELPICGAPCVEINDGGKEYAKKSPLKWKELSLSKECESLDGWEDPHKLTSALEKIEAWIFSRIIESVWWQTLTPHMQSAAAKAISTSVASDVSRIWRRTSSSGDQERVNFSLDLWKKAFKDACERLCPVRAGGHECGCLPVLARLVMEQCVARLDVAMFNAILRESDDELPTDPVSDPISDAKVLPIQAGKASFGAGAQLKNAIGNWSRWLTDLFGIEDDDSIKNTNNKKNDNNIEVEVESKELDTSFKAFHLLNALSDLMMLPKDMLLSRSIRKEVCPTFGAPLIKRVLINFLPDEFCPDQIPDTLLEALDSEDEAEEVSVPHYPCNAAPIVYVPPPLASVDGIIGEAGIKSPQFRRSGSSVLKKLHTSDDELDELDSPLTAIIDTIKGPPTPKENGSQNSVRYQLLREVWTNTE